MENASKALIIAGAILLSILIIAIGIFIFNGANSTIVDSMSSMSTQEKEAFNNQFLSYEGNQSGSNVKSLIGKLVANSNTYAEEKAKIPTIELDNEVAARAGNVKDVFGTPTITRPVNGGTDAYVNKLGYLRESIDNKHQYKIVFSMGTNGLIDTIKINY